MLNERAYFGEICQRNNMPDFIRVLRMYKERNSYKRIRFLQLLLEQGKNSVISNTCTVYFTYPQVLFGIVDPYLVEVLLIQEVEMKYKIQVVQVHLLLRYHVVIHKRKFNEKCRKK